MFDDFGTEGKGARDNRMVTKADVGVVIVTSNSAMISHFIFVVIFSFKKIYIRSEFSHW